MVQEHQETGSFNLNKIVAVLKKNKLLILGIVILSVTVAGVTTFSTPPIYEAETTIRVQKPKGLNDSLLSGAGDTNPLELQQLMSTYSEILRGRTVVEKALGRIYPGKPKLNYQAVAGTITTQQVNDTELLKISVQSTSPREAANLADTLVSVFLERLSELVSNEQHAVRGFLSERLEQSKTQLQQDEVNMERYKKTREIVAPQEMTQALVNRVSQLNQLVAENQINLATSQTKLDNINKQLGEEKSGFIADSNLIQQHKAKLAELEIKLVGLVQNYTDKHPDVVAAKAEIEATRKELDNEVKRVVSAQAPSQNPIHINLYQSKLTTEIELAAAQAQKGEIDQVQSQAEREIRTLPAKERELARLMREANLSQELYVMLAKRYEESRIGEAMQPTDVQVVEKAVVPDVPVQPKKVQSIMVGVLLGLFSGISLAFLLDSLNKTLNTAHDVKKYMGLPVLGSIEDFKSLKQPKNRPGAFRKGRWNAEEKYQG